MSANSSRLRGQRSDSAPGPARIRLAGQEVPLGAVRTGPGRFAALFRRARALDGAAYCLCRTTDDPPRLVIRCRAERYHLAGWPDGGGDHAPHCEFHKPGVSLSGRSGYTAGAVVDGPDGVKVRLSQPLQLRLTGRTRTGERPVQVPGAGRSALGLTGLLHLLWERAALNQGTRTTARRSWWHCHTALAREAADITVSGQDLADVLYVVPPFRKERAAELAADFRSFCEGLAPGSRLARHGLLLGEIKKTGPAQHGAQIAVRHLRKRLFLDDALHKRLEESFRPAFSSFATSEQARRIGLFVVARTSAWNVSVIDAAVMLATPHYVPADSSYEVEYAEHLVERRRAFHKPVRWDGAATVFPDFVLTDTGASPVYVEIYGVQGRESYELRKQVKREQYRAAGTEVVEWEPPAPLPDVDAVAPARA